MANKPDSHDICFIPDGDTRGWLAERIDMTQGEILDHEGKCLGSHEGAHAFTVGQRKGLKLGVPAADGKPRFVLEIRPKENKVIVGPEALLAVDELRGIRISWAGLPIADAVAGTEFDCMVQVRAHGDPVDARAQVRGRSRTEAASWWPPSSSRCAVWPRARPWSSTRAPACWARRPSTRRAPPHGTRAWWPKRPYRTRRASV